jgi:tetratricopeptide (TPR) repeat protein
VSRRGLIAIVIAAACTRPPARLPGPSAAVRAEIDQAETAERARQHDVARTHYQRAVAAATDPASSAFARREYAETLITWGEFPEAIAQLEGVVEADPDDAAAWHDLGMLRHHEGNDTAAIAALERSKALAPRDFRPRRTLAVLRWKRGDKQGALAEYQGMLALDLPERLRVMTAWAVRKLTAELAGRPFDELPPK